MMGDASTNHNFVSSTQYSSSRFQSKKKMKKKSNSFLDEHLDYIRQSSNLSKKNQAQFIIETQSQNNISDLRKSQQQKPSKNLKLWNQGFQINNNPIKSGGLFMSP